MIPPGVQSWDPHRSPSAQDIVANGMVYSLLLEHDPVNADELIGDLAESWQISPDGLTFTFNLRKGVKWNDGETLDADDVVFSLIRVLDKSEEPRPRSGKFRPYMAEDPVAKVDQYTLTMKLAIPSGAFVRFMAMEANKILPKHVLDTGKDINIFDADAVGSGPWKYVAWKEGISIEYERNNDYFKEGRPYFDGMKAIVMSDKGTEIAAYKTERILMGMSVQSRMDVEDAVRLEGDSEFAEKFDMRFLQSGSGMDIWMNMAKPPFDNEKVRRAIFLIIDRDRLTDNFGLGKFGIGAPMSPLNRFALPEKELRTFPGYRQLDGKKHPDDLAEAKRLMAEAGFADGFKTSMMVATTSFWTDAAQIFKQEFKDKLNIDVDLNITDIGGAIARRGKPEDGLILWGASPRIVDPDGRFSEIYLAGGPFNWSGVGYEDPAVVKLFKQQQTEQDFEKRKAINHDMQRLVLNGAYPVAGYTFVVWIVPVSKRIRTEKGPYILPLTQHVALRHDHEWLEPE